MAFDLSKAIGLKNVSKMDTGEILEIKVSLLDPNPNNFFSVEEDITALCESIKVNGLLQSPVVTPSEDGRYRIIAGHRRHKALQALSKELPDKFGTVLCRVVRPSSPALEELMLIQTNTEAREIGYAERNEAAKRVEKILVSLKEQGVELPGKMRSHVARLIKASESQIARAKYIAEHLIEQFQKASGISDSTAYKLAHLPSVQQADLYGHYKNSLWDLGPVTIDHYLDNIKEGREPFAPPHAPIRYCYETPSNGYYPRCSHCEVIARRKKDDTLQAYQKCAGRTCCTCCAYRFYCEDVCPVLNKQIEKVKAGDAYRIGQALRHARCDAGISLNEVAKKLNLSTDQVLCYETTQVHTTASLLQFCELYKVTPNEILGFDNAPASVAPAQWTAPENVTTIPDGMYSIAFYYTKSKCGGAGGKTFIHTRVVERRNGRWLSEVNSLPIEISKITIVAVTPFPEAPDGCTYNLGGDASGG